VYDLKVVTMFNKMVSLSNAHFFSLRCGLTHVTPAQDNEVLVTISHSKRSLDVTRKDLRSFRDGFPLSITALNAVLELFSKREERIFNTYSEIHREKHDYVPLQRNSYMRCNFFQLMQQEPTRIDVDDTFFFKIDESVLYDFSSIFFPVGMYPDHADLWSLAIIDVPSRVIRIFNPMESVHVISPAVEEERFVNILETIMPFLDRHFPNINNEDPSWTIGSLTFPILDTKHVLNDVALDKTDPNCAISILAAVLFLSHDILVCFSRNSVVPFRKQMANWILEEHIPF
jgi:hypothetical protein